MKQDYKCIYCKYATQNKTGNMSNVGRAMSVKILWEGLRLQGCHQLSNSVIYEMITGEKKALQTKGSGVLQAWKQEGGAAC